MVLYEVSYAFGGIRAAVTTPESWEEATDVTRRRSAAR